MAGHPARIPGNRPVLCIAPSTGWVKCNSKGLPRLSGYCCLWEYILEQNNINYGLFFSIPWVQFALYAEIMGAIFRIENAFTKGWFRLWLECDSQLAAQAFKNSIIVPRRLISGCLYYMEKTKHINIHVTRIFRERNFCAEK